MKRKIIAIIVWILASVLFCANAIDVADYFQYKIYSSIESYGEMKHSEGLGEQLGHGFIYNDNKDDNWVVKQFGIISVTTCLYVMVSIGCYHYIFKKEE